ncbi:Aspartyl protease [Candidatus Fervidibacteria bacterium JGI MDM2 SSWTFF-3-K9]
MGRIIKQIEIEGQPATALFDTGANYTYVRADLVQNAPRRRVAYPVRVALGGQEIEITEVCIVEGTIEGLSFFTDAVPVAELGEADGHQLDAIIGSRTMEQWEIRLDPSTGELDLEGLRRREFKEW